MIPTQCPNCHREWKQDGRGTDLSDHAIWCPMLTLRDAKSEVAALRAERDRERQRAEELLVVVRAVAELPNKAMNCMVYDVREQARAALRSAGDAEAIP